MKKIPAEVTKYLNQNGPRKPVFDCEAGVARPTPDSSQLKHRLVVIGDSLSHGFQSGAVFNTELSYPAIIAHELGWFQQFRYPKYAHLGGLPLNLEVLLRRAERRFGLEISGWREIRQAAADVWQLMDDIETYWERGDGNVLSSNGEINHCLAVYGWDLRDALALTSHECQKALKPAKNNLIKQAVQNASERAALRVYPAASNANLTFFSAARALAADGGIETLIVFLGANNALQTVTRLDVVWSKNPGFDDPAVKANYTVWQPSHFKRELNRVVAEVRKIGARRVIWCTVPHVTVAPIARGVDHKKGTPYFDYYTRPWISDADFDRRTDKHLTGEEVRAVDAAIDMYNDAITAVVCAERTSSDWYLFDVSGLMDRLAHRRYIEDGLARPNWWTEYQLPAALQALTPKVDSQFLTADGAGGRRTGGLFSLDGVHPTTVGYGIIAQELIKVMCHAGVVFNDEEGNPRQGPVEVDFNRLIQADTLVKSPPQNIGFALDSLGWLDETIGWVARTAGANIG